MPAPTKPSPAVSRAAQRVTSALPSVKSPEMSATAKDELRAAMETARRRLADGDARGAVLAFAGL